MKLDSLNGKKIVILGYGKEGKATEQYLKKMAHPASIGIADRTIDPDYLSEQKNYDLVIKTPGINKERVNTPYTTATNIFFANCKNPVIGVTGTKGKSTTSSLIHHILTSAGIHSRLIGNIGNPALTELLQPVGTKDIFVMELSSYQLDDIHYSPHISVILNLFPEHMNYHGSVQNYYEAKKRIVANASDKDYFVYNSRYHELQKLADTFPGEAVPFEDLVLPEGQMLLKGKHNLENIRAALVVCRILGISDQDAFRAVAQFKPLPHRLEFVGLYRGIEFYDDAISTTPESTCAALDTLENVGTLLLGGLDRGYDYSLLAKQVLGKHIPNLVLFPDAGKSIRRQLEMTGGTMPRILETDDMEEAVRFSYRHTPSGTKCLLSTAAPSYSIWKNFEEKGDLFKHFIHVYAEKPAE